MEGVYCWWAARLRTVCLTFQEFLESRTLWNRAVHGSVDDNIFLTWEWLSAWWKHFGDKKRFLVIAVTDDTRIMAAAPLMTSTYSRFGLKLTKLQFIGTPQSDYQGLLLTRGRQELATAVIEYAHDAAPDWDLIELGGIPETFETARILGQTATAPWKLGQHMQSQCPYIPLPSTFDNYFDTLSLHFRKNLKTRERSLARDYDIDFRVLENFDAICGPMRVLFELHGKRRAMKDEVGIFSHPAVRNFHLDVAKSFAERGWLVVALLTSEGEPIAAQYAFRYANRLYCYQAGFDPQYSKYGVGSLLEMYLIRHCIREGLREYDFGLGDEPYKMQWGASARMNLQFTVTRRKLVPLLARCLETSEALARTSWRETTERFCFHRKRLQRIS